MKQCCANCRWSAVYTSDGEYVSCLWGRENKTDIATSMPQSVVMYGERGEKCPVYQEKPE